MRRWMLVLAMVGCGGDPAASSSPTTPTLTTSQTDTDSSPVVDSGTATPTHDTDTGSATDSATATDSADTGGTTGGTTPTGYDFEVVLDDVTGYITAVPFGDRDGDGVQELLIAAGHELWSVVPPPEDAPGTVLHRSTADALLQGFLPQLDPDAVADVDGDGLVDAWVRASDDRVYLFTGLPTAVTDLETAATAWIEVDADAVVSAGDLDGNGLVDVLVHDEDDGAVLWFEAPFLGALTAADAVARFDGTLSNGPATTASGHLRRGGDLTGDGLPDVLVGSVGRGRWWLLSAPSRTDGALDDVARSAWWMPGDPDGGDMGVGDVDGDGVVDAVFNDVFGGPHPVRSTWNVTDALVGQNPLDTAHTSIAQSDPDGGSCGTLLVADLDADGQSDLAMACPHGYDRSGVYVLHGPVARGDWELQTAATYSLEATGSLDESLGLSLSVGDLDGDGDGELLVGASAGSSYYVPGAARLVVTEAP